MGRGDDFSDLVISLPCVIIKFYVDISGSAMESIKWVHDFLCKSLCSKFSRIFESSLPTLVRPENFSHILDKYREYSLRFSDSATQKI